MIAEELFFSADSGLLGNSKATNTAAGCFLVDHAFASSFHQHFLGFGKKDVNFGNVFLGTGLKRCKSEAKALNGSANARKILAVTITLHAICASSFC
jgi:hypothetical protein